MTEPHLGIALHHIGNGMDVTAVIQAVSMGIYRMEPEVLDLIPRGVPFGFDDLMLTMLYLGLPRSGGALSGLHREGSGLERLELRKIPCA